MPLAAITINCQVAVVAAASRSSHADIERALQDQALVRWHGEIDRPG